MKSFARPETGALSRISLIIGAVFLALSVIGFFVDKNQFFFSYQVAFTFWLSIGLGGLFLTLLHHVFGATWSIVLRRIMETIMSVLPWMVLFFLPMLLGLHELFHWTHSDAVAHDPLLQQKQPYLNVPFFIIRAVIYFSVWIYLARWFYKKSVDQDKEYDHKQAHRLRQVAAPAIILFALTLTFAAFDWMMSLDPHWYSTIYGVYYFAGSTLATISILIIFTRTIQAKGGMKNVLNLDHYHDMGKMLFTFVVFWAYIAFSQYFLIWYANIPEETLYYFHRWEGNWKTISLIIVFGKFVIPFLILITRSSKRNLTFLTTISLWLLLMQWLDLYWMIMPTLHPHSTHFSWLDVTTLLGIGGVFVGLFFNKVQKQEIVPVNDPKLPQSLEFTTH
ncbi:hypothetical protein GF406_19310 [candidate division KSB1 bacterium]|nr:hypothetical protein [candidate division KSB1 bacterium]